MLSRLSLKYRIALIIFLLESIMMTAVLRKTLGQSCSYSARLIRNNEVAILDLVSEDSRSALITEEYIDFQTRVKGLLANSDAVGFHLADDAGTVVASSEPSMLGRPAPPMELMLGSCLSLKSVLRGLDTVRVKPEISSSRPRNARFGSILISIRW